MINQFEKIRDYNTFFCVLQQLKPEYPCCKKSYLTSPNGQRFHLNAVINFAQVNQYLTNDTIQLFTKLNEASKQRVFSHSPVNCLEWVYRLLLRIGDAIARFVGLGYKDLKADIHSLIPNRQEPSPVISLTPSSPSSPFISPTSLIPKPVDSEPTPAALPEPLPAPVPIQSPEEHYDQVSLTPKPVDSKLPEAAPEMLPIPSHTDHLTSQQSEVLSENDEIQVMNTYFKKHFPLYLTGQTNEIEFLRALNKLVDYPDVAQSIFIANIDSILKMNPESAFIKWFSALSLKILRPLSHQLLNTLPSSQFLDYFEIISRRDHEIQFRFLCDKLLHELFVRYPNDEKVLDFFLIKSIYFGFGSFVEKALNLISPKQLINFVQKRCVKNRQLTLYLIDKIPFKALKEKLPIIISALNSSDQQGVTVNSMIKELDQLEVEIKGPNFVLMRLYAYKDAILLASDLPETEKQAALLERLIHINESDIRAQNPALQVDFWFAQLAATCDAKDLKIIIKLCRDSSRFNSLLCLYQFIVVNCEELKIEKAFVEFWPYLITVSDQNYTWIYSELFSYIPNAATLGTILKTFPLDGKKQWLKDLVCQNGSIKISKDEIATLLIAMPHLYHHLDHELLTTIFSNIFEDQEKLSTKVRQTIRDRLFDEVITSSGMPAVHCNVVKNYLLIVENISCFLEKSKVVRN